MTRKFELDKPVAYLKRICFKLRIRLEIAICVPCDN